MGGRRALGWLLAVVLLLWWVQQPGGLALSFPDLPNAAGQTGAGPGLGRAARADIPRDYLGHYQAAARTCPKLTWTILAGIGKIESDHGRSSAPGVQRGLNRAGCCAGPMQFNLTDGPPSTWQRWRRPGDNVYAAADAIGAAARKLCGDGLAGRPGGPDPCPDQPGNAALHRALKRYNNACWYVADVLAWADRYRE
jgi:hypothetical protein